MRVSFVGMVVMAAAVALTPRTPLAGAESSFASGAAPTCGLAAASESNLLAARPSQPYSLASPHFVVHYAVPSLEDYARDVIDAAEHSYRVLVDTLAHAAPPSDGDAGGDNRTDIYLRPTLEIGGAWGTTVPDTRVGTPYFNSFTSWIELADDLPYERRITVTAHEVYHVVQLGYDRQEGLTIFEMFSAWFEDRAYDSINSNYIWLPQFFRRTDRALFEQNYTNVVWAIFLTQRYGDDIMRATLERCGQTPGPNARGAFDGVLQTMVGSTLIDEFVEFGTWNFFVSLRDDGQHYSEGRHFPALRCQVRSDCYPVVGHDEDHPPRDLAANYFLFDGDGHRGRMWIRVDPEPLATAYLTVIRFHGGMRDRVVKRYDLGAAPDSFVVDWPRCDSLLAIYQIDRGVAEGNRITISARYEHESPPAAPWTLVLDRDGCRNPFDGKDDEFARRDGEEAPIAAALAAAQANPFISDEIPFDLSRCRAVFVVGGFGDEGVTLARDDMVALQHYLDNGGDIYLESTRLGAWVDSSLAKGEHDLPSFWSMFGSNFQAGQDTLNVATWRCLGTPRPHQFAYDRGEPDYRVGALEPLTSSPLVVDDRNLTRATVRVEGESVRIVSTVLLGASTGISGSTREAFLADVLALFDDGPVTPPAPPATLLLTRVFPNPARATAELTIESPADGPASIVVYDVAGRRISESRTTLVTGSNAVLLPTPRASGVYFLRVESGSGRAHGRFLVIR